MKKHCSSKFFLEPENPDPSFARRGESEVAWLERSTHPRARECRRFLNEHLSRLPSKYQVKAYKNLKHKWESTFFEIILVRILQELGASVEIERSTPEGKRPDFWARFNDGSVVVEATVPVIDCSMRDEEKQQGDLLDFIESIAPSGWWVCVCELPPIGPQDSKREFKRVVKRMLDIGPPKSGEARNLVVERISTGTIRFELLASGEEGGEIGITPVRFAWDTTEKRIKRALGKKGKQVRGTEEPALLAIHASGLGSDLGDFDKILFGRSSEKYDGNHLLVERGFEANGIFLHGNGEPTFAGVLAFITVGFPSCDAPVLYVHPRFSGSLPSAIMQLEQRIYDPETNRVRKVPARAKDLIDRLNLVKVDPND